MADKGKGGRFLHLLFSLLILLITNQLLAIAHTKLLNATPAAASEIDRWLAFYGSANTQEKQIGKWQVGLAEATSLAGTWKRLSATNPVALDPQLGVENPVVTRLQDGTYMAVFDVILRGDRLGYTTSPDGLHWSPAQHLVLDSAQSWVSDLRTPLGLIDEGGDHFTLHYTGYSDLPGVGKYGSLGVLRLKLVRP